MPTGRKWLNPRLPPRKSELYNYFRDYDPSTGRYIESDPIGLVGGLNTYLYANANPLRFVDPNGLVSLADALPLPGVGSGIGGLSGLLNPVGVGVTAALYSPAAGEGSDDVSGEPAEGFKRCKKDKKPDCRKASKWDLRQAGIFDEHAYKREHGAVPEAHYDICKCKDGTIRIAAVGQCGRTSDFWE